MVNITGMMRRIVVAIPKKSFLATAKLTWTWKTIELSHPSETTTPSAWTGRLGAAAPDFQPACVGVPTQWVPHFLFARQVVIDSFGTNNIKMVEMVSVADACFF